MNTLFDDTFPVLPYNGTSGWSGSDASRDRAIRNDSEGITGARQRDVFQLLVTKGKQGLTWNEAGHLLGMHHGTVSAALSNLHRENIISRLKETRSRSSVYVCNEFVSGRETSNYKPNASARRLIEVLNALADDLDLGDIDRAKQRIKETLQNQNNDKETA